VGIDLRRGSSTYGEYVGMILFDKNKKMFYTPEGFAHGFLSPFSLKRIKSCRRLNRRATNFNWRIK